MKNGGKIVKSSFRKIGIKYHPENRGKREFTMGKNWEITQEKTLDLTGKILEFTDRNGEKI